MKKVHSHSGQLSFFWVSCQGETAGFPEAGSEKMCGHCDVIAAQSAGTGARR